MKSPSLIPLLALSAFSVSLSLSGQVVSIADWQGNKSGAISMTFDDALSGHWSDAAPIMTAAGVNGTFFVITGSTDWDGARAAALNGHEIGSHSTIDATLQNDANAALKMQQSHDAIEAQIGTAIPGYQCHTIAWPYGYRRLDVVNDPLYHDLYISARNAGNALLAGNSYNSSVTTSWWKYGLGDYGLDHYFVVGDALMFTGTSLATFEAQLDLVATQNAWTVFTYHGIETGGYQNISAANFTDQVAALAGRSDDLYIAPYGEIARYIRERDAATASLVSNDGTTITVSVTDTLDDSVFNIPLTLIIDAPAGWAGAEALQNGLSVPASVMDGKILVNAVPDAGNVTITEGSGPAVVVVPEVTISPLTETSIQLSWETVSGLQYEVMTSTALSGWASLDPAIVVDGDDAVHDQEVPYSGTSQFYQLSVTTAP
jgi:peptidoglycan/xylan/chitin deacetylase (PgdA/CDA1 family)